MADGPMQREHQRNLARIAGTRIALAIFGGLALVAVAHYFGSKD